MKSIQICLGENIRKHRVANSFSQVKLAEATGLSVTFVQNVEAGKRWVGPKTVSTLARALKISESELFLDCDQISKPDPKEMLLLMSEALGILLSQEIINKAPTRRPFAYFSHLYESIPDEIGEDLTHLCKHPNWDWIELRETLGTMKRKYGTTD